MSRARSKSRSRNPANANDPNQKVGIKQDLLLCRLRSGIYSIKSVHLDNEIYITSIIGRKAKTKQKSVNDSIDVLVELLEETMVSKLLSTRFHKRRLVFEAIFLRLQNNPACLYTRFAQKRKTDHPKPRFCE